MWLPMPYRGSYHEPERVVVVPDGRRLDPARSIAVRRYSRRFDWVYHGRAPAQLGLARLLAHTDNAAVAEKHHKSSERSVAIRLRKPVGPWPWEVDRLA